MVWVGRPEPESSSVRPRLMAAGNGANVRPDGTPGPWRLAVLKSHDALPALVASVIASKPSFSDSSEKPSPALVTPSAVMRGLFRTQTASGCPAELVSVRIALSYDVFVTRASKNSGDASFKGAITSRVSNTSFPLLT